MSARKAGSGWLACFMLAALSACGGAQVSARPAAAGPSTEARSSVDLRSFAMRNAERISFLRPRELGASPLLSAWRKHFDDEWLLASMSARIAGECQQDVASVVEELLLTGVGREQVAAFRSRLSPAESLGCAKTLLGRVEPVTLGRYEGWLAAGGWVAVVVDDLLVVGKRKQVAERIVTLEEYGGRFSRELPDFRHTLGYVSRRASGGGEHRTRSIRLQRRKGLFIELEVGAPGPMAADMVVNGYRDRLGATRAAILVELTGVKKETVAEQLLRIEVRRAVGAKVVVSIPVQSSAKSFDVLPAFFERLDREAIRHAAITQAAHGLRVLAEQLIDFAKKHPMLGRPAFPVSAPLLTGRAARASGDSVVSRGTWKHLDFRPPGDSEHAYQIVTEPTRRAALLRATADLDSDGETSILEIRLRVDDSGEIVSGRVQASGDSE